MSVSVRSATHPSQHPDQEGGDQDNAESAEHPFGQALTGRAIIRRLNHPGSPNLHLESIIRALGAVRVRHGGPPAGAAARGSFPSREQPADEPPWPARRITPPNVFVCNFGHNTPNAGPNRRAPDGKPKLLLIVSGRDGRVPAML